MLLPAHPCVLQTSGNCDRVVLHMYSGIVRRAEDLRVEPLTTLLDFDKTHVRVRNMQVCSVDKAEAL